MTTTRFAVLTTVLAMIFAAPLAADPAQCTLCGGVTAEPVAAPARPIPLLIQTRLSDLAAWEAWLASASAEQRRLVTLAVHDELDSEANLDSVEGRVRNLVAWTEKHGPFRAVGLTLAGADPTLFAYGVKRMAVEIQGRSLAQTIALGPMTLAELQPLYAAEAQHYFDEVIVAAGELESTVNWLRMNDPVKKITAVVPADRTTLFSAFAAAFTQGASRAFATGATGVDEAVAAFNAEFRGDFVPDTSAAPPVLDARGNATGRSALVFVRGEDLRRVIVPAPDPAAPSIISLPEDDFTTVRRIVAGGEQRVTDVGRKGGRFLIGVAAGSEPLLLTADRSIEPQDNVTREAIDVTTARGISVEEIIRNHQAYWTYQRSLEPTYIAKNQTDLRFAVGEAGSMVEATLAGDYFSRKGASPDWVWKDFLINGVRWKYGRIPELPLIQPEKVTQLPLDIHLSRDYRYELVREAPLDGYQTYEVRFEPPPGTRSDLPLYRGTVWIDKSTWARVRLAMVQLNLSGEVLSNEERVEFVPYHLETKTALDAASVARSDPRKLVWLPARVTAQQVLSTAGRATAVSRSTRITDVRLDPPDFDERLRSASAANVTMVRETEQGLRYLERRDDGTRVVKEGFDTGRLFLLGGLHHDDGLEFPVVPLGGIDYFNFNWRNTGLQTNLFFAGVITALNVTEPSWRGTRTNLGLDVFGLAIPFETSMYRNDVEVEQEAVTARPFSIAARVGHPAFGFGKADLSLSASHISFGRTDTTAAEFREPSDTWVLAPGANLRYDRWGYSFSSFYEYGSRTDWEPWGIVSEYHPDQKTFHKYGASAGKSFFLPNFQRLGIELNYMDGARLDRFSKYELGFFGARRIRGVKSGSVRAERALLAHLSYGLVFSEQFRLEAFYDAGRLDDASSNLRGALFQGVGIGGQTIGPYGTIVRLDIGKTVGENAQDGFVANVVFLKLFN